MRRHVESCCSSHSNWGTAAVEKVERRSRRSFRRESRRRKVGKGRNNDKRMG